MVSMSNQIRKSTEKNLEVMKDSLMYPYDPDMVDINNLLAIVHEYWCQEKGISRAQSVNKKIVQANLEAYCDITISTLKQQLKNLIDMLKEVTKTEETILSDKFLVVISRMFT